MAIALILNAKKSLSSWQLSRDLDMHQTTAWYLQVRVRLAMGQMRSKKLLRGIVEADETFIASSAGAPANRTNISKIVHPETNISTKHR